LAGFLDDFLALGSELGSPLISTFYLGLLGPLFFAGDCEEFFNKGKEK